MWPGPAEAHADGIRFEGTTGEHRSSTMTRTLFDRVRRSASGEQGTRSRRRAREIDLAVARVRHDHAHQRVVPPTPTRIY